MRPTSLAFSLALSAAAPAAAQVFSYPDFTSVAGLELVERAAQVGPLLRVHDNTAPTGGGNRGAVWFATPVDVANGFDTTFVFNMNGPSSTGGGDGMAFVIQNDLAPSTIGTVGNRAIGNHASACGYGIFAGGAPGVSVDNSLAIELDCFNNATAPAAAPINDPDGNHISIHTGGTGDNNHIEAFSIGRADTTVLPVNLNDGQNHTLRVTYIPGTLTVTLDGSQVLVVPYSFANGGTHIDTQTPVGGLNLIGGSSAYVGFTAASGGVLENHDLVSWTWASAGLGTNYCVANSNSTGAPSRISATGSASVAANNLVLRCSDMPTNAFAFFLTSTSQGFVANPAGSQGNLCLSGSIGRYVGPGQIQNSGAAGAVSLAVDLTRHPTPGGLVQVVPGQTWNFTTWHRDVVGGVATSNFSNGIVVGFAN